MRTFQFCFFFCNAELVVCGDEAVGGTTGDVTWGYTRNPASQILSESQSNDSYAWDGHVNLTRAYTTNGLNQYESAGSATFCYDANGNLTADGNSVYRYDVENRLVEKRAQGTGNTNCAALSYAGALQAQLLYDPTGRLYQVSGGTSGIQRFAYDGNAMIGEYNASGTMLRRYVHGSNAEADDPLIWYEGATQTSTLRRYLHADPRGSIVAVTDHTGNRIATNTYDEYGIPDTATSAANSLATKGRFRYTGQAWIPELGMYYYKARIYSPTLGRFLQTDPIGYEDQFNLYAYVANDPVNEVDPTGMYGRGEGFSDRQWREFDRAQKGAARDMEITAGKLERKAERMDREGSDGSSDLRQQASALRDGAAALNDDGSNGFIANSLDEKAWAEAGASSTDFAYVDGNAPVMNVFGQSAIWERSDLRTVIQFSLGHESLHSAGFVDQKIGTDRSSVAYRLGSPSQQSAYRNLPYSQQLINPDHLMSLVYPRLR